MRRLIAPLLVLTGLFAPPARADLQAELKDTFQGLLNVTPAESYATQRRGVISGGSIELRTNLTTPNLISFVPPSVKAGCGGIDLFGGSFSFINGQQLNQLMRNIAQMATSYAFQLAVEGLCPTCAQIMTKLQKDIQFINGLLRGDCGRVKQLVDSSIGPTVRGWSEEIGRFTATSLDTEHGFLEDAFKGLEQTPSPSATAVQHGQAAVLTGNTVKQALDESATIPARPRTPVQRLDAHVRHPHGLMPAPDLEALSVQRISQQSRVHEGVFQGVGYVVDAAPGMPISSIRRVTGKV